MNKLITPVKYRLMRRLVKKSAIPQWQRSPHSAPDRMREQQVINPGKMEVGIVVPGLKGVV